VPHSAQMSSLPDLVNFERVALRYGRGPEVLTDATLDLPQGSFTFLTGPSGAGKSSLLKLCYLSLIPSRGLIRMFGRDIYENVALPLRVSGASRSDYHADVVELLQWVGLGHRMQAYPPTLSGGEKQRCAIARAVIAKPDLLIADEPTGNVDPIIGKRLLRLFAEMNRMGTTVLIATHDTHLIDELDARILRIENGRIYKGKSI